MSIFKRSKPQKEEIKEQSSTKPFRGGEPGIIKKVSSSEKSLKLREKGQYVFMVSPSVNKKTVKTEVERRYGVKVSNVNVIRADGEKKAVVTLAEGQKIDL